ncbi:hypothetical protein LCGC14_2151340 [marine sediment metagenome]|uniref:Uncharacterized protein n=1 Tax=marine sediment metagenome TaxID=412755 RepID=A0A0F9EHS0_9ZZZZ
MYEFQNDAKQKFVLPLNPTTVGRVHRETGFDLRKPEKLRDNLDHAVIVLHSIARRQCTEMTVDELRDTLPPDVLEKAIDAVGWAGA